MVAPVETLVIVLTSRVMSWPYPRVERGADETTTEAREDSRPSVGVGALAAAARGAAALADVATAGGAHLGAAGEAERGVGGLALHQLQQLGRGARAGGWLDLSHG